jgi:DNA-binding beta-propeller fold protein YncE
MPNAATHTSLKSAHVHITLLVGLSLLALLAFCAPASAAQPLLWQRCEKGSADGQCDIPRGIGVDAQSGHLYVADQSNNRIVELTAWGEFVKAWGWGVRDGSSEPQTCTVETTCRAGIDGGGKGELNFPQGVAVDSDGNVYVVDPGAHRVQKFTSDGQFIWMIGGNVNKTAVEGGGTEAERNLCTAASGNECQLGTEGAGNGQFGLWPAQSFIAVGPADQVYVGDQGRIQEFAISGHFIRVLPDPEGLLAGKLVNALAADPQSGDLYLATAPPGSVFSHEPDPGVLRIDPLTGEKRYVLNVEVPTALGTDSDGNVYVFNWDRPGQQGNSISRIMKFDSTGNLLEEVAHNEPVHEFEYSTGIATGSACLQSGQDLYVSNSSETSFVKAYGPPPNRFTDKGEKCAPPEVPPTIEDEYALAVGPSNATLGAAINPHFWPDTHYYVEYGTGKCTEGGCPVQQPVSPGSLLGGGATDAIMATEAIHLSGLAPGTTYHYRFVASSSGGGPTVGAESTFTTFRVGPRRPCPPNEPFRTGPSAALPDCRAYEMLSPVDKEGAELEGRDRALFSISTPQGDDLTYSSFWPFADPKASPFESQFLAHRDAGSGWTSRSISPPQEGENLTNDTEDFAQIERSMRTFSPDLSSAWLVALTEPVLAPGAQVGFPNIYRAELAGGTGYRACTTTEPAEPEIKRLPEFEGSSDDDRHGIFVLETALTPDANPGTNRQLYECSFGEGDGPATVRLVSILPNGGAATGQSTAGTEFAQTANAANVAINEWWLDNAISADGSRVFWTTHPETSGGPGSLYVRVNASQEQSPFSGGKCSRPGKACTYPLSEKEPAQFWGATPSGSMALFSIEGKGPASGLYLFGVDKAVKGEPARTLVAKGNLGVLGASDDLSRVYFLSEEAIGGEGAAGEPNLYLYEAGATPSTTFLATLSKADTGSGNAPTPISTRPNHHAAHVSPDGAHLAFSSSSTALGEATAGYDNRDPSTGQPNAEVYRYGVGGKVVCVSCNPSGARPANGRAVEELNRVSYAIAILPTWTSAVYPGRPLSADGSRLFFESFEPLVPSDTNESGDVYQWEEASLAGGCQAGDPTYVEASGGCLDLISSGKSTAASRFLDANATGADVFFTTGESLVPQDPGSIDVYDARVGGGFPSPPAVVPCEPETETCQSHAPPPPAGSSPATSSFHGAGNEASRKHCPKGRRKLRKKGRVHCVPRHRHHHKPRGHHKRRNHR